LTDSILLIIIAMFIISNHFTTLMNKTSADFLLLYAVKVI